MFSLSGWPVSWMNRSVHIFKQYLTLTRDKQQTNFGKVIAFVFFAALVVHQLW